MVKRPRKARLSVHLLWIISSALVAGLLATDAAREASAPDGCVKAEPSAATELALAPQADPRGDGEEQSRRDLIDSSLAGPRMLEQLGNPFLESGSGVTWTVTSPAPTTVDGIQRPAWEELFERCARHVDLREPEPVTPPLKPLDPSSLLAPAPTRMASATSSLVQAELAKTPDDGSRAPLSLPAAAALEAPLHQMPQPTLAFPTQSPSRPGAFAETGNRVPTTSAPTDSMARPSYTVSSPPETMASQIVRTTVQSVPKTPTAPAAAEGMGLDSFGTSFQTEEPELVVPLVRTPLRGRTVRQLLREIFTPSAVPMMEVRSK